MGKGGPKGPAQKKAAKKAAKQRKKGNPKPKSGGSGPRSSVPGTMSAVNDGVNTGVVWKNTHQVRDHFNRRFEKVMDLSIPDNFFDSLANLYLNPGNSVLFPVFSQIAGTYEEFICHLLRFWYRGEEYTASGSNISAGVIGMATNMDPDDTVFTNMSQLENYEGSVSGPPFVGHMMHDVFDAHKTRGRNRSNGNSLALNQYFVYQSANQAAPAGSTAKFYDIGLFQAFSNGCQQTTTAGELWVEHEWTMIRRKQETPIGSENLAAHVVENPAGTATSTHPLGSIRGVPRPGSTIPIATTGSSFNIPIAGTYVVCMLCNGGATTPCVLTIGFNVNPVEILVDNQATFGSAVSSGNAMYMAVFDILAAGTGSANLLTISGMTGLSGTADVFISQVPGGLNLMNGKKVVTKKNIADAFEALCERFDSFEKRLAQVQKLPLLVAMSEPDTPCEEIKEAEALESSVHISKSAAEQLLRGLGLKK